jgi:hypothetical protein
VCDPRARRDPLSEARHVLRAILDAEDRLRYDEALMAADEFLDRTDPGHAEAVAGVGYVFTSLHARSTGLPIDVWVGDDAPLVVAWCGPGSPEVAAAVRRWVVVNRDALTDHWAGAIDSAELTARLRRT